MSKILVTGGAGYIGSHTVVELVNAGYEPVIIDDFSNSSKKVLNRLSELTGRDFVSYEVDCKNYNELHQILTKENVDGIIHFAAFKAVGESVEKPLDYYENNLVSLINLLRLSSELDIKHFVFSSSCTVYGEPDDLPVNEDFPVLKANSPYGNTKQIGEEIIQDTIISAKNFNAISLRYFNPIGAHPSALIGELPLGKPNNLVPYITQTAIGKYQKLTIFGDDYPTVDGTNVRDYIHVVDLAKAHVKSLDYLKNQNSGFMEYMNLGTGKGSSVLEVVKSFEKVNEINLNYEIGPRRPGDVVSVYADPRKANKELNWKAELSLEDALRDAWKWEKKIASE